MNIYEAAPHCVTQRYRQVARGRLKQLEAWGEGKRKLTPAIVQLRATNQSHRDGIDLNLSVPLPLIQFPLRFLRTAVCASENSKVTATLRKTSIQK